MILIRKSCTEPLPCRGGTPALFLRILPILVLGLLFSTVSDAGETEAKPPLPRFASLRSSEVNMRVGPGMGYTIKWVYRHEGLPVEIIQEFDVWREVRDSDGTVGWVHKHMLQNRRMAIIKKNVAVLRRSPDERASPVVRAEPGVTGKILECETSWCRLQISGHKGWLPKTAFWGAYKNEKF